MKSNFLRHDVHVKLSLNCSFGSTPLLRNLAPTGLNLVCKLPVFYHKSTFIATFSTLPKRWTIKNEKVNLGRTTFWAKLQFVQEILSLFDSFSGLSQAIFLFQQVPELFELKFLSVLSTQWTVLPRLKLLVKRAFRVRTSPCRHV